MSPDPTAVVVVGCGCEAVVSSTGDGEACAALLTCGVALDGAGVADVCAVVCAVCVSTGFTVADSLSDGADSSVELARAGVACVVCTTGACEVVGLALVVLFAAGSFP